jgi:hypothetical protein
VFTGVELTYEIRSDHPRPDICRLEIPEPVAVELGRFDVEVAPSADGVSRLTARSSAFGTDLDAARHDFWPRLQAWGAQISFAKHFQVRYVPQEARSLVDGEIVGPSRVGQSWDLQLYVGEPLKSLPIPSPRCEITSAVVDIDRHWREYCQGRSRLTVAANYACTVLKRTFHPRDAGQWAKARIDTNVLETLNDLSSNRSHPLHERKSLERADRLSDAETDWLRATIPAIGLHLLALAAGDEPPQLTLNALPALSGSVAGAQAV